MWSVLVCPCSLFASTMWHTGQLSEKNLSTKNLSKHFFLTQYSSPLNTEMTVNVSEHCIRDGAAGLSECSLWSAMKSENQLVQCMLDETHNTDILQ